MELLGSQVREFFPFYPSAFPFPEPPGQGPLLLYLEPGLPPFPLPVQSLNWHHGHIRPLLPLGDLLRGAWSISEIPVSSALFSFTISQAHLCVCVDHKPGEGPLSQELQASLQTILLLVSLLNVK